MALDINNRAFSRLTYIQLRGSIRVTGCSYVHDLFEISFFFIITNLLFFVRLLLWFYCFIHKFTAEREKIAYKINVFDIMYDYIHTTERISVGAVSCT